MREPHSRSGAFVASTLIVGAAFGLLGFGLGSGLGAMKRVAPVPSADGAPAHAPRSCRAVDRYWAAQRAPDSARELEVRLLSGMPGEVLVHLSEVLPGPGFLRQANSRVLTRAAGDDAPIAWELGDGRTRCLVRPARDWGSTHYDTGLGLAFAFELTD